MINTEPLSLQLQLSEKQGQTYSVPVYGGNNGTTTTVKNSWGQTIGSLESQPSNPYAPTGYQTHYREGYTATVRDRWLFVNVWRNERGSPPEKVSQGQVYPEQRDQEFFENQQVVRQATQKLLTGTVFGMVQRAPASASNEAPGCWPRLGLSYRKDKKLDQGAEIEDFAEGSKAPKAGLKKGDVVLKIADQEQPSNQPLQVSEGQVLPIIFLRNGKEMKAKVPTAMFCLGE